MMKQPLRSIRLLNGETCTRPVFAVTWLTTLTVVLWFLTTVTRHNSTFGTFNRCALIYYMSIIICLFECFFYAHCCLRNYYRFLSRASRYYFCGVCDPPFEPPSRLRLLVDPDVMRLGLWEEFNLRGSIWGLLSRRAISLVYSCWAFIIVLGLLRRSSLHLLLLKNIIVKNALLGEKKI